MILFDKNDIDKLDTLIAKFVSSYTMSQLEHRDIDEIRKLQVNKARRSAMVYLPWQAVKSMALSEHDKLRIRMIQDESEGDKLVISKVRLS